MTLEGNGIRTYYAAGNRGELKWMLKETTADLVTLKEPGQRSANDAPVHVRLDPGWVWSADGNRIVGRVEKTTPAPEHRDIPWTLFRIASPADSGALRGVRYIQWISTHAGRPPDRLPARAGEVLRVPFYARYGLYH